MQDRVMLCRPWPGLAWPVPARGSRCQHLLWSVEGMKRPTFLACSGCRQMEELVSARQTR